MFTYKDPVELRAQLTTKLRTHHHNKLVHMNKHINNNTYHTELFNKDPVELCVTIQTHTIITHSYYNDVYALSLSISLYIYIYTYLYMYICIYIYIYVCIWIFHVIYI